MRRGLRDPQRQTSNAADADILTVSALTRQIKSLLEGGLGQVAVEGEVSALTRARSGHVYITMKDEHAVLDVVLWRSTASRLSFVPEEGQKVVARGAITVYEPRGRYQLVATSLQPAGRGELQQRFDALVKKLRQEGLFGPEHKQPLPTMPATIGVVTSATGAAVRDIIKVLRRRLPGARIVLSPCLVQGAQAAEDIVAALRRLERWGQSDVIILGRGGGSLEDLWAFNEEVVARAIFAARTPIVSAVGHEVDVTIADLVADVRAATPSEAAETVAPDMAAFARQVRSLQHGLRQALLSRIRSGRERLSALLRSPALRRPLDMIRTRQQQLDESVDALVRGVQGMLEAKQHTLSLAAARLEGLSPLGILSRGYSVTRLAETGRVIRTADDVEVGDRIRTHLAQGQVVSEVTEAERE